MIEMKTSSIRYFCGATYQGSWQQGKRHGYGEMAWPGSGSYKGFFKHDLFPSVYGLGHDIHAYDQLTFNVKCTPFKEMHCHCEQAFLACQHM